MSNEIPIIDDIPGTNWTPFRAAEAKRAVQALDQDIKKAEQAEADEWPEPTPLPKVLPPVAAFETDLVPEALRDWVTDIAHRMQCPADFTAVAAVVALSSLIGARATVSPKAQDDWQAVPNLWGLVIGNPGVMKSPAMLEAIKPLSRLEDAERKAHLNRPGF